jgi:transposase
MKDDYMRNGQLKPGYNLQIGVVSEYICAYDIFSNPSDSKTLIPFLEKIKLLDLNIKNIVADAGYESIDNYEYLEKLGYTSYIKPIYFEKLKTRKLKKDLNFENVLNIFHIFLNIQRIVQNIFVLLIFVFHVHEQN